MIHQETFNVVTENKSQSQILFHNLRSLQRHTLLYENFLIFCKVGNETEEGGTTEPRYQFKFSLPVANLAVNTKIKGEDRKLEIWTRGETDLHILEASSVVAKEDFVR